MDTVSFLSLQVLPVPMSGYLLNLRDAYPYVLNMFQSSVTLNKAKACPLAFFSGQHKYSFWDSH